MQEREPTAVVWLSRVRSGTGSPDPYISCSSQVPAMTRENPPLSSFLFLLEWIALNRAAPAESQRPHS